MEHVVFLCHRIPYPPNKGDKIRSYHLLQQLRRHYRVHIACFIDDPADRVYMQDLEGLCESICGLPLSKTAGYVRSVGAMLSGTPLTLAFYRSSQMRRWITDTVSRFGITRALVFSSSMAQYIEDEAFNAVHRVIDFVDVDSAKWGQYAERKKGPARWIYGREYRTLRDYENSVTTIFDSCLFVSQDEAELFKRQLPACQHAKVSYLPNGVDTDYFDPQSPLPAVEAGGPFIAFTGAMDYWANVDAVIWFCEQVWPHLRNRAPELQFLIVGGNPARAVRLLENIEGVRVTGRVPDVRPYLKQAALVVAPLRIARGIQNKVLEAMAMARPIVATSMAMEGIRQEPGLCLKVADDAEPFIEACQAYLARPGLARSGVNREHVIRHYGWQQVLAGLPAQIEGGV